MRIGIYDIDSQMKSDNRGVKRKYPNVACGKMYGYHKTVGDEVVYPWKGEKVDRLYISTIFTSTKAAILRQMSFFESQAKEVVIGGSGWDDYSKKQITKLPPDIDKFDDPKWLYEMYDLDYGIGFSTRGCHVGCGFCMVWRKEGLVEYSDTPISKLINPKSKHLVLMNNNSLAHDSFFEDVEEIKAKKMSIHWDQANDITLVTPLVAEALASVDYRSFDGKDKELVFAFDLVKKRKVVVMETASENVLDALNIYKDGGRFWYNGIEWDQPNEQLELGKKYENSWGDTWFTAKQSENPLTRKLEIKLSVEYDMMKVVPRKIKLMQEHGINPKHLMFYVLIGFNSTEEEDLARIDILREFKSRPYPMLFRDLTGKVGVDGSGKPQSFHCRPFRDWVTQGLYKTIPLHEFDRYPLRKKQFEDRMKQEKDDEGQMDLFEFVSA